MVPRLGTLYSVFESRGLRPLVPTDLPPIGVRWYQLVVDTIREADWVVGVPSYGANEIVFFELGIATALDKRCLLLVEPDLPVPLAFESLFQLRTSVENRAALELGVDRLLNTKRVKRARRRREAPRNTLGSATDEFLQRLELLTKKRDGVALERLVQDALQRAGVTALANYDAKRDWQYDIAAWVDELHPYVGNPLPIEVKYSVRSPEFFHSFALASGAAAPWALLVYVEGPPPQSTLWGALPPTVMAIKLSQFFERLRDESFVEIVRDLRNRVVHGMAR